MDRPLPHALIVDDDPSASRLFCRCLSSWGWNADISPSVPEALEQLAKRDYRLALCDVNVRQDDGIVLAKDLLKIKPLLFIIIVSGDPRNLERARDAGFTHCLRKLFGLDEFKVLLDQYEKIAKIPAPRAVRSL